MFETGVVQAVECLSQCQIRRHNRDIFSIFFNMKVFCVLSIESPHQGDSNEYTQYTIFNIKKEYHPKLSKIYSFGIFSMNEFETTMVNEPSVFEPLKVYCIIKTFLSLVVTRKCKI